MEYRVISIGTLSEHPLWDVPQARRTAHATTTLIRTAGRVILVDPALPAEILEARCQERAGIGFDTVTDVFLTSFRPAHRRALPALTGAKWWIHTQERETIGRHLIGQLEAAGGMEATTDFGDCGEAHSGDSGDSGDSGGERAERMLKADIALLQRCHEAPDRLAPQVDLFPVPGFTPGTCGLLLTPPSSTILIAGDAAATCEHFERGQVLQGAYDVAQARQSLGEIIEIADWIIPGHDNLTPNLTRGGL
ncbi:MAG: hypothetical protein GVY24_04800 [Planctomycetes bacterium]|jgi:glyoxylase-like metal-dependent hydrolase (beta-lactamase superfamily II)|nr:hypothetical protein [Planctomycetota bacterium]